MKDKDSFEFWLEAALADPSLSAYSDVEAANGLIRLKRDLGIMIRPDLPWERRRPMAALSRSLYELCFAKRCAERLSHYDYSESFPLNMVCFMWWESLPLGGQKADPHYAEVNELFFGALETALSLPSIACHESALHGLGHARRFFPERAEKLIDSWKAAHPSADEDLLDYARRARKGDVE